MSRRRTTCEPDPTGPCRSALRHGFLVPGWHGPCRKPLRHGPLGGRRCPTRCFPCRRHLRHGSQGSSRHQNHAGGPFGMGRRSQKAPGQRKTHATSTCGMERRPPEGAQAKANPCRRPLRHGPGPRALATPPPIAKKTVAPTPWTCIMAIHAGVAELADAYGSGPYEGSLMKVQVLSPAPSHFQSPSGLFFLCRGIRPRRPGPTAHVRNRSATRQDIVKYFLKISSYLQ